MKLKMSIKTYFIPYDDELYFINLEDDINDNLINVSKKDVDDFMNKHETNFEYPATPKDHHYIIWNIDNEKDVLIMEFILKEIEYGIDRDWYDYVTCWRETQELEFKETLKQGKKEIKILSKKLRDYYQRS